MVVAVDSGSTASYVYDAFNRRVRKTVASTNYDYTYDLQGRQLGRVAVPGLGRVCPPLSMNCR